MRTWAALGAAAVALAACSVKEEPEAQPTAAAEQTGGAGVTREEVPAPTPTASPMQLAAIQTQPGPKGNTVALNRASVTGDILTVSMTFTGSGDCCVHIPVDDVSIIDDATSQRSSVLKDNNGKWMASPLGNGGKNVDVSEYRGTSQVWFKFPAPPATSRTISVAIPGAAPFDAVPVTR